VEVHSENYFYTASLRQPPDGRCGMLHDVQNGFTFRFNPLLQMLAARL